MRVVQRYFQRTMTAIGFQLYLQSTTSNEHPHHIQKLIFVRHSYSVAQFLFSSLPWMIVGPFLPFLTNPGHESRGQKFYYSPA